MQSSRCVPFSPRLSFIDVAGGFGDPEALRVSYRPFDGPPGSEARLSLLEKRGLTAERTFSSSDSWYRA